MEDMTGVVDLETGEVAIGAIEEVAAVIGEEEEDRFEFRGFRFRNDSTLIIQQLIIDYVTAKKIEAQKDAERPYERQHKTGRYDCFWNLWIKIA
jgi:hypothetical protein